jgi:hypothetical protein
MPEARDPATARTLSQGRCYLYVAPCAYEDLLKLGFSRDPLERLQSLHRRWFEFFDLERIRLVETESVREARSLELALHHQLSEYNTPVPLTIQTEAGGAGEWYRGAYAHLQSATDQFARRGYRLHAPARDWLRRELLARAELLYSWVQSALSIEEIERRVGITPMQAAVRDALDAFVALDIPLDERLPPNVLQWYRAGGGFR